MAEYKAESEVKAILAAAGAGVESVTAKGGGEGDSFFDIFDP